MYTLKIKWMRHEKGVLVDESTLFIAADQVQVHGEIQSLEQMSAWEDGSYFDYSVKAEEGKPGPSARIIQVDKDGKSTWYLASFAWLMGINGQTIERLTA